MRRYYENAPIPAWHGEKLYPCGVLPVDTAVRPSYQNGLELHLELISQKDPLLASHLQADFGQFRSFVPAEHGVGGNMFTHSMPNYPRIIKEGLLSYLPRIEKIADADMREGLLHVVAGIRAYIDRCVAYLKEAGADDGLCATLRKVPLFPAENIREAIFAWNFVMYLDSCDNLGSLSVGLAPFYRGEDVRDLLGELFDNLDQNEGYSLSLQGDCTPLILQALEAVKGRRRPMIELFVDERTPDAVWQAAFEAVKSSGGQPAFYNGRVLLSGIAERFSNVKTEDLPYFCGGGCTESMIGGFSAVGSLDAGIHLLLILERAMQKYLPRAKNFEDFYTYYLSEVAGVVDTVTEGISLSRQSRAKTNPLPMRTLLVDDCIDSGKDFHAGGARYNWSVINFAGVINVIDSLLFIKDTVFDEGRYTAEELLARLAENDTDLLEEAKNHPIAFGRGDERADSFAHRFTEDVYSLPDGKPLAFGEGFLPASIQFNTQAWAGACIGATPDGRASGTPLCDSLAAIFAKDTEGPTSLLRSVASLDLSHLLGVPVLNFNVQPDFTESALRGLILGYFAMGGIQMQITCISKEMLLEAYEHPQCHRNLVVRVGG